LPRLNLVAYVPRQYIRSHHQHCRQHFHCATIRSGSLNEFAIDTNSADPAATSALVFSPASWCVNCRSKPISAPNPSATNREGSIYFNNRAPAFLVDAPFLDLGGCGLEGTNWLAQLVVSSIQAGPFLPAGDPLPFLTGIGAGYLDTRQGALRSIPSSQAGTAVWARIQAWDATKGATYDEAKANGGAYGDSAIIQVTVSGSGGGGAPPLVPSSLTGLQSFSQPPPLILSPPVSRTSFVGGTAEFHVTTQTGGSKPITYRWQKFAAAGTNWADIPGANTDGVLISPVTAESAGSYRVIVDNTCQRQTSNPASLAVLQPPSFTNLTLKRADGSFSFTLTADAGHNYGIEASTNLTNWISIRTLTNFPGTLAVTDSEAADFGYRFYRVTLLNH